MEEAYSDKNEKICVLLYMKTVILYWKNHCSSLKVNRERKFQCVLCRDVENAAIKINNFPY